MQIGRFTPYESLASSALAGAGTQQLTPPAASKRAVDGSQDEGTIVGSVPPAPTEEAREQVDLAAERVDQLHAANRELHFSRDQESGRVIIEVRDLEGNVLKTIPPSKALDILSGADL
jgi:flagellar protein FlaG